MNFRIMRRLVKEKKSKIQFCFVPVFVKSRIRYNLDKLFRNITRCGNRVWGRTGRFETAKRWQQKSGAHTTDVNCNDDCCRTGVSAFRRNHFATLLSYKTGFAHVALVKSRTPFWIFAIGPNIYGVRFKFGSKIIFNRRARCKTFDEAVGVFCKIRLANTVNRVIGVGRRCAAANYLRTARRSASRIRTARL